MKVVPPTGLIVIKLVARMKQAAEQSDGDALVTLANEIGTYTPQTEMADAARRLMGLTQKFAPNRAQEVAELLIQAATPAYAPYAVVATALDSAAPREPGVAAFMANRQKAKAVLQAALAAMPDAEAMSKKMRTRLARILWQIGDEEGLSDLVAEVAGRAKQGGHDHSELVKLALMCMGSRHGQILREPVSVAVEQEPDSPDVLHVHVRGLIADRHAIEMWWPRLKQAVFDHPQDAGLKRFAALCAYDLGEWALAEQLYHSLAHDSDKPVNWEKAGLAALRNGHDEWAIEWLDRARPRVSVPSVGTLADHLKRLLDAINRDYIVGDVTDHIGLRQELEASLKQLRGILSSSTEYAPSDLLQAAVAISTVEQYPFYVLSEVVDRNIFVEHWDARYGTFDLRAYSVVWRALVEHQAMLLDNGLKRMIQGAALGSTNALRETAKSLVLARLTLHEPEAAMQALQALSSAGCNGLFFQELTDQCLLHQGNVSEVETRVRSRPSRGLGNAKVCGVAQAREWVVREQLETRVLWEEGPYEARFEKAVSDGQVESHEHQVAAFTLSAMEATSLMLAGSEVLIGSNGTALRPSHWHYAGIFPQRTGIARTAAAAGVVLDLAGPERRVEDPVVLLACNDAVHVTNYFHWINFVLTRCVFLLEQGLLEGRRLLMPAELQPWMRGALELVGLSEDHLLNYSANEVLHIAEATVVSAFNYPGAEYMRRFRSFMWKAVKADSDSVSAAAPIHIFMARPSDARRPFLGREQIVRVAQDEGFDCIDPSKLSVAEQVKLFTKAASVAGFGGAAFTNMAFCRPGMPALELTRRETTWPDYTGIALALGIKYRFCPGTIDPSAMGTRLVHDGPTRFDQVMVQRELNWLKSVSI